MADSFVRLPADGVGKLLDTRTAPDGDHREVVVVGSPTLADVVEADLANGLDVDVTRVQGSVAVTNAGLTALLGAIAGTEVQVDIVSGGSSGVQYTEDDAAPANPVGTALAMVRDDALSGQTTADGDIVAARSTDKGELYVKHVDAIPVTDNSGSLTVDNPILSVVGGGTEATAQRVTIASDSTGVVSVDDNGGTLTVDGTVAVTNADMAAAAASLAIMDDWDETDRAKVNPIVGVAGVAAGAGAVSTTVQRVTLASDDPAVAALQILDNIVAGSEAQVDVITLPALVAGSANIGDVDIASVAAGTVMEVVGDVAADAAVPANPIIIGGRASTAQPTPVSADGDSVNLWTNRKGSPIVAAAPHVGLLTDPWALTGETAQYTTTQTSAVLVAGGASERIVVTKVQIQVGGTTAGMVQLYFGTGAYARGTNLAIFDGEFAPSATLKPGVVMDGPFISATNGDDLLVTTSAAINPITFTVWYYIIT